MGVQVNILESYKNYGRCLKLENGTLEILITIDVGPRIIYFGAVGGENMFFNDEKQERVTKGAIMERVFGKGAEYHFYGGHRMWLAPQVLVHTTVPDNTAVPYELISNGVILKPAVNMVIGMQPTMTVVMDPNEAKIDIDVSYTNVSTEEKSYAVWQISQFDVGGVAFIPFAPEPKKRNWENPTDEELLLPFLPEGQITNFLGAFTEDPRFILDARFMTLQQDPENKSPFKIGTPNRLGYAMYANKGYVTTMRFEHDDSKTYTDNGCSFEAYTDALFLELESLGAFETVRPGATITHKESLSLQKMKLPLPNLNDRGAVAAFIEAHQ